MSEEKNVIDKLKMNLPGNAADLLVEKFRSMILSGEIPAGYVFPSETRFCEQLGVSRSTLREAYKALENTGFITRVKRNGTMVNDFSDISRSASLGTSLIMSDLDELMEFRVMIEGELASLAAQRISEENLAVMREALHQMSNTRNLKEFTRYDTMFHMEVAKAARNRLLISTMENAQDAFQGGIYQAFQIDTESNLSQALEFHTRILEALERRDSAAAYTLMRQHINSVSERMGWKKTLEHR